MRANGAIVLGLLLASCDPVNDDVPQDNPFFRRIVYVDALAAGEVRDLSGLPAGPMTLRFRAFASVAWTDEDTDSVRGGVKVMYVPTRELLSPTLALDVQGDTALVSVTLDAARAGTYVLLLRGTDLEPLILPRAGYSIPASTDLRSEDWHDFLVRTVGSCLHVTRVAITKYQEQPPGSTMLAADEWQVEFSEDLGVEHAAQVPAETVLARGARLEPDHQPRAVMSRESPRALRVALATPSLPPADRHTSIYYLLLPDTLGAGGFTTTLDCGPAPTKVALTESTLASRLSWELMSSGTASRPFDPPHEPKP